MEDFNSLVNFGPRVFEMPGRTNGKEIVGLSSWNLSARTYQRVGNITQKKEIQSEIMLQMSAQVKHVLPRQNTSPMCFL